MILRSRMLILAATLPFVAGCGMYLHRPELAASTAALKTSYGALSAPAYLEQQQQRLEQFAAQEDRTIAEFHVASRDNSLLNIVGPGSNASRAELLQTQIGDLLLRAAGMRTVPDADAPEIVADRFQRGLASRRVEIATDILTGNRAEYQRAGGTSARLACNQILEGGARPPSADPPRAQTVYRRRVLVCEEQRRAQEELTVCTSSFASGNLFQACDELARLRGELGRSMTHKEEYDKAVDALRKAIDRSSRTPPAGSERYRELVDQARSSPNLEDYREVLEALDDVFGLELTESLGRLSQARDRALAQPVINSTYNALVALEAIDRLTSESGAPLDQPSALLIGLAKVRHDLNVLEVEIDRIRRLIALKEAEVEALRRQIHYLVRAQCALRPIRNCAPANQPFAEALSHYVSSFDNGLIPYQVLLSRELQIERAAAVRNARATEADYRALLSPAIDQLAAYGAGGIRPEVLGQFLANLPVTGAILGR